MRLNRGLSCPPAPTALSPPGPPGGACKPPVSASTPRTCWGPSIHTRTLSRPLPWPQPSVATVCHESPAGAPGAAPGRAVRLRERVCMQVSMCVHVCACMCRQGPRCAHVHVRLHACACVPVCAHMCACVHMCIYACVCKHVSLCGYVCARVSACGLCRLSRLQ